MLQPLRAFAGHVQPPQWIQRRTWLAAAMLVAHLSVRADTVSLSPADAQAETQDGAVWTIDAASTDLNGSLFSSIPLQRRGILEFDIRSIPVGSVINSVTLAYRVSTFTSGSGAPARLEFHGYAGDGVLQTLDATRSLNRIGITGDITVLGTGSVNLSAGYLQSLRAMAGTHLGLMMTQATPGRQAAFYSSDWFSAPDRPVLTVDYTPPQGSLYSTSPNDSAARRSALGVWTLDTASDRLTAYRSSTSQIEDRAVIEFALRIPYRSCILSAELQLSPVLRNSPPDPVMQFHGYAADGAITLGDLQNIGNIVAVSPAVASFDRFTAVIDTAFVESMLGNAPFVGLLAVQPVPDSQLGVASHRYLLTDSRPVVNIVYIPPACAPDFNGAGGLTVQDLFDFLNAYFANRPAADFDLSGLVTVQDIFDYINAYFAGCS